MTGSKRWDSIPRSLWRVLGCPSASRGCPGELLRIRFEFHANKFFSSSNWLQTVWTSHFVFVRLPVESLEQYQTCRRHKTGGNYGVGTQGSLFWVQWFVIWKAIRCNILQHDHGREGSVASLENSSLCNGGGLTIMQCHWQHSPTTYCTRLVGKENGSIKTCKSHI